MRHLKNLLILVLLWLPLSSNAQVEGLYLGYWGRSTWSYGLNGNGKYRLKTTGHIGELEIFGSYKLSGDTVILFSNQNDAEPLRKLLAVGDSCLVEVTEPEYVYRKTESDLYQILIRDFKNIEIKSVTE